MNPYNDGFTILPGAIGTVEAFTASELASAMYALTADDDQEALMLESVTADEADWMLNPGDDIVVEAVTAIYNKLDRKMQALVRTFARYGSDVKPYDLPSIGPDRKNALFAYKTVTFTFDDGQTVSILFHAPDSDPRKFQPDETLIAYRWLLNKRDITATVSPINGRDIDLSTMAKRIMQLVEANSDKFKANDAARQEQNEKLAELEQSASDINTRVEALTQENITLTTDIEDADRRIDKLRERLGNIPDAGTRDGEAEPHYSEKVLARLIADYGWEESMAGYVMKDVGGGYRGMVNPEGARRVGAKFIDNGRWLSLNAGPLENLVEMDGRELLGKDDAAIAAFAAEFDRRVRKWAVDNAKDASSLTVSADPDTVVALPKEVDIDDLPAMLPVEVTDVGSENVYFTKDDVKYFCKVGNTEAYSVGTLSVMPGAAPSAGSTETDSIDPTTPEGYARVSASQELQEYHQDQLDSLFGSRMVDVRNALRALGWEGEQYKTLSKNGVSLTTELVQVGAGMNVVGVTWRAGDESVRDDLTLTPELIADAVDALVDAPAATTAEHSEQYASYLAWIQDDARTIKELTGIIEEIDLDERLNDGEADMLREEIRQQKVRISQAAAAEKEAANTPDKIDTEDGWKIPDGPFAGMTLTAMKALGFDSTGVHVTDANGIGIGTIERADVDAFVSGTASVFTPADSWRNTFPEELKQRLGLASGDESQTGTPGNLGALDRALHRDIASSIGTIIGLDDGTLRGYNRSAFTNSIVGKLKTQARNGNTEVVDAALLFIAQRSNGRKKPILAKRNAVWSLAGRDADYYANLAQGQAPAAGGDEPVSIPDSVKQTLTNLVAPLIGVSEGLERARNTDRTTGSDGRYAGEYMSNDDVVERLNNAEQAITDRLASIADDAKRQAAADFIDSLRPDMALTDAEMEWAESVGGNGAAAGASTTTTTEETKVTEQDRISGELQALIDSETDTGVFDQRLDEIAEAAEAAGLMDEMDGLLNAAADKLTELLNAEAANVA